jgi:hypothetical protein
MKVSIKPCVGADVSSSCEYCSLDMDMDFFCVHPDVIKAGHPFGLYINRAREEGKPCGPNGKLWKRRKDHGE